LVEMQRGTPGWGQGVYLISAMRSAAAAPCLLTPPKHDFVPHRRLQTRAITSFSPRPIGMLQRRPRRQKQKLQQSTAAMQPRHPAHSSARTRPEAAQSVQVRWWGYKSSCWELQPCSPPPTTASALPARPGAARPLAFSRCLFPLPFPSAQAQIKASGRPAAVPAAGKPGSSPSEKPHWATEPTAGNKVTGGTSPDGPRRLGLCQGFLMLLLCSDETLYRKI